MSLVSNLSVFLRAMLLPRAMIVAENLALRQRLAVLHVSVKRPRVCWSSDSCAR